MGDITHLRPPAAQEDEEDLIELEVWVAYDDDDAYAAAATAEEAIESLELSTEGAQRRLVKVTVRVPRLVPLEVTAE